MTFKTVVVVMVWCEVVGGRGERLLQGYDASDGKGEGGILRKRGGV